MYPFPSFSLPAPTSSLQIEEVQKMAHNKAREQEARALRQQGMHLPASSRTRDPRDPRARADARTLTHCNDWNANVRIAGGYNFANAAAAATVPRTFEFTSP